MYFGVVESYNPVNKSNISTYAYVTTIFDLWLLVVTVVHAIFISFVDTQSGM